MATLRFEPIATSLGKHMSPGLLFPREVLDRIARGQLEGGNPGWSPQLHDFMLHYTAVAQAGMLLLGAPPFERLSTLMDEFEEEYQPGGPPMSPVYDSYSAQHILAEVPQGLARETPYSVVARLSSGDAARARLCELAGAMASSHLDLYRVLQVGTLQAEILPLRGGDAFSVQLTGPFLRNGDVMLARVVPFGNSRFIADSPYLLVATEREWLDYLERCQQRGEAAPREPAAGAARASHAKLTPKQMARRRKQQKLAQARRAPDQDVVAHLRYGDDERFWLEFIMDAYAGERNGIVRLAGVPDRPESLPNGEHYVGADVGSAPPLQRVRSAAMAIAEREGFFEREARALEEVARSLGVEKLELNEGELHLLTAYCMLGARSAQGLTALELSKRETAPDPEELAIIDSIQEGHFAVLRIQHIQLDEGIDALDVLRARRVHIRERLATRQLGLGDLLLGWLCAAGGGEWTLEGGLLHVPSLMAGWGADMALQLRDQRRAQFPRERPNERAAALVIPLLAHMQSLRKNPPLPALYNTHGERLQLATARYQVLDRERARAGLSELFEPLEDDRFAWIGENDVSLGEIELGKSTLTVHVNSLERLEAAKARIEAKLGDAVRPSLGTLDGDSDALHARVRDKLAEKEPPLDMSTLPKEALRELNGMLLQQIRSNFDQPIPAFKGKTLRQVARSKSKNDAVSWLREQERILRRNPQFAGLDMQPLWSELGLEYRGLDSDGY